MNIPHARIIRLITILTALLFIFSCTKDSDLLTNYVVEDSQIISLVKVKVVAIKNEPIIIETLSVEDEFEVYDPEIAEPVEIEPVEEEPVTIEPETSEPETAEPETTEQETTEPETTEPETSEPETTEPETSEPETTEPETSEPETTEPETSEPETTEPEVEAPEETEEPEVEETEVIDTPEEEDDDTVVTVVTPPAMGTAEVNDDNSITYTPDNDVVGTDEFEYTTETTNADESVTTETVNIKVTTVNSEVEFWKAKFDAEWTDQDAQVDHLDALQKAKSRNRDQEYYFLGYYIDGLVKMWQATGENSYLDTALNLINITVTKAVNVGGGFRGWPNDVNKGYALWDSFYWRHVATLLRIMNKSPNLRSTGSYQKKYKDLLDFTEKHIWNRYESGGTGNFYRSKTHMASHWARIGMELFIITGKQKYKKVFDNISFGTMDGYPSNLRNQLKQNSQVQSAYKWSANWTGVGQQDTSHGGAIVSFWVEAFENGMYWKQNDMNALVSTLDDVIWKNSSHMRYKKFVDGSGNNEVPGRIHEWLTLGRFDQNLHNKIKNNYTGNNLYYFGIQPLGIAALNARILADGAPVYPEIN
jgi:chemotaxis protein histidine kinase CheA